ncbi:arylsulfatase [Algoriphagus aquimarinus]|uniref:sulfatase family protein n=1 Tax=Algoriphagus aquimarinus TaxID=237018 RepID=UPI0030DAEFFE|tara:strand:+ start:93475 stop:94932 length:1458 start_codon:yes stop_codon:yes gene_type:complete
MRNSFSLLIALFVTLGGAFSQENPPNVIVIMADDLGYGDLSSYNTESKIQTPNMDKLAAGGIIYWDGHSASSICTPSRYAFITGNYPWRSDLIKSVSWSGYDNPLIKKSQFTIADMMKEAGYTTGIVGKWHLGINFAEKEGNGFVQTKTHHESGLKGTRDVDFTMPTFGGPNDLGFDYWFGSAAGHNMEPFVFIENRYTVSIPKIWREAKVPLKTGLSASEVHEGWMAADWDDLKVTSTLTAKAIEFINDSQKSKNPFFLYFAHTAPHRPSNPTADSKNKSKAGDRGDMVYELDQNIGEVIATLEALGIKDNTLIIVTSDNGGTKVSDNGEDYGHRTAGKLNGYKASLLEGGHRVPFIAYWPKVIQPNSQSNALVTSMDIMATLADVVGVEIPVTVDSESFYASMLSPQIDSPRDQFIHSVSKGTFALRKDNWKYIYNRTNSGGWDEQLYDLQEDLSEKVNLATANQELCLELRKELFEKIYEGN